MRSNIVISMRHFVMVAMVVWLLAGPSVIGPNVLTPEALAAGPAEVLDDEGHLSPAGGGVGGDVSRKAAEDREIEAILKGRFVDRVSVDMVMVPAVVEDRKGRPVLGLMPEDFTLFEEGQVQEIEYFALDNNQPVSIAFVLDVSGSMRMSGRIRTAKEAVRYFLTSLRSKDQAALIAFADRQVAVLNEFGTDREETLKWLEAVKAYGQTALNDAVAAIPALVDRSHHGRKAIVLITDGVDNYSTLSLGQAMGAASAVDVPIYAIGFAAQSREVQGKNPARTQATKVLDRLSRETGGVFSLIHDPDDMKEAVRQIEEDLRSQYVLGYTPVNTQRDGRFRKIALQANNRRYTVRARTGYVLSP
jgi:Ca-activated chloride channel family protein